MSLRLMMDVHVPSEITDRLRAAGVDTLTAQEDGSDRLDDDLLLNRADSLGRALFSNDTDFLRETASRQQSGIAFGCVFYAAQDISRSKEYAEWLEMYAKLLDHEEVANQLIFIP